MSTTASAGRRVRVGSVVLWVVQVGLALSFVMAALPKLTGDPAMTEMFNTLGPGDWLRYLTGALEVAGAIGLLIPRLSGTAALGLTALMVGATLTNVVALGVSPAIPLTYLVLAAVIAWFRRSTTSQLVKSAVAGRIPTL